MGSIRVTLKSGEESIYENVDCRLDGQYFIFSSNSKDVLWISADNVGAVSYKTTADVCGVITNDNPPIIGGLDASKYYKCAFVSSGGAKLFVDASSDQAGSVSAGSIVGTVRRGDVVKMHRD